MIIAKKKVYVLLSWLLWKLFQLLVSFDLSFAHFSIKNQPILDTQLLRSSIFFHECMYIYTLHVNLAWRKIHELRLHTADSYVPLQNTAMHQEISAPLRRNWQGWTKHVVQIDNKFAKGCCIATTMTLTSIKRKAIFYVFHVYRTLVFLKISIW